MSLKRRSVLAVPNFMMIFLRQGSMANYSARRLVISAFVLLSCVCCVAQQVSVATAQSLAAPPIILTSERDHQRTMELLHISSLRQGPDGDPKSPDAANFEESKVNSYALPDPLIFKNGKKVTTVDEWWKVRRPEIVEDFDKEIYGRVPAVTPQVNWEVKSSVTEMNGEIPVVTKTLVGHVDNSAYPFIKVDIQLSLSTPADAKGGVPVMMEIGISPVQRAALAKRFPKAFMENGPTWQQQVLARGWGYATLVATSIQADNGDGLTQGIIGLANKGQPRKVDDWGTLRAWAWGASRALDYFETNQSVDAKRVGIEGLSRYGKAALVAMAYEPRLAVAFVGSSGAGGAKILRRNFGEQVENIASTSEYHWMAGNFLKYAGPLTTNDLPVDAHELIALCAPRPVFISSGSQQVEGGWVDARGMFLGAVGAGPVYKLLGKRDLGTNEFPPIETALIDGDIAFRQHSAGHTTGPNWPAFLEFAGRYFDAPSASVALTFDDLPVHGPLPPGLTRDDIAKSIIRTLQDAHAPPIYGFVNAKRIDEDPGSARVLQLWRDAGFPLGNHTFSHMDLHTNSVGAFEHDILINEPTLRAYMGDKEAGADINADLRNDWHWLRYPFLREGDTPEKYHSVRTFLNEHGYKVAEVTLSFADYAYNDPYARCLAKSNSQAIEWLQQSYLSAAKEDLERGQEMSQQLFGRDIKHVMLLHIGGFETVMLPRLLDVLQQRGVKLITLPEAESDPAYAIEPDLPSNWSGTFLQQMMVAKHIPEPPRAEDPSAKLDALCR
jgi:peptidoglycan/xylan/chitin deacetylase (PgdA/CDA1 family)